MQNQSSAEFENLEKWIQSSSVFCHQNAIYFINSLQEIKVSGWSKSLKLSVGVVLQNSFYFSLILSPDSQGGNTFDS